MAVTAGRKRFTLVARIALGILLGFVLVEVALRVAGWSFTGTQSASTPDLTFTPDEFRIVTLGESTTAQFSGGRDHFWPGMLEAKLNSAHLGRTFRVVNLARGGTSSPLQLEALESQMGLLRPHLVVSMMGVNDTAELAYLHTDGWRSLRAVKVISWGFSGIAERWRQHKEATFAQMHSQLRPQFARERLKTDRDIEAARVAVAEMAQHDGEHGAAAYALGTQLVYDALSSRVGTGNAALDPLHDSLVAMCADFDDKAHASSTLPPRVRASLLQAELHCFDRDRAKAIARVRAALLDHTPLSDDAVVMIAMLHLADDASVAPLMRENGFVAEAQASNPFDVTLHSYRRLGDMLAAHGVAWVAMMYPTARHETILNLLSVAPRHDFKNLIHAMYADYGSDLQVEPRYAKVVIADNEDFNRVVNDGNRDQYFTDMFTASAGGHFGHTTTRGHDMIASNCARAIVANWQSIATIAAAPR